MISAAKNDLASIRGEIAARSQRDMEISAAKNAPRSRLDQRRDRGEIAARYGNLGGQKRAAISPRSAARSQRDMEISAAKNAPRSRLDPRRDRSEIWKSRRANTRRDVAARSRRDGEISVAKNTARSWRDIAARPSLAIKTTP